jgi:hypothetical protein
MLFFDKGKQEMSLLLLLVLRYIRKRDVVAHGALSLPSLLPWPKAVQLLLHGLMTRKENNAQEKGVGRRNHCVHMRVAANFNAHQIFSFF